MSWTATCLYALEYLRHSADDFAQPPESTEPSHGGWALVAILLRSFVTDLAGVGIAASPMAGVA